MAISEQYYDSWYGKDCTHPLKAGNESSAPLMLQIVIMNLLQLWNYGKKLPSPTDNKYVTGASHDRDAMPQGCGGVNMMNIKYTNVPLNNRNSKLGIKLKCNEINNQSDAPTYSDVMLVSERIGDFDSLIWTQVPDLKTKGIEVVVHYTAINEYDVKYAQGSILNVEKCRNNLGYAMDFSGLTNNGSRVMGLVKNGAARTRLRAHPELLWPVPAHWSLEDAATVPLAYSFAFYCLFDVFLDVITKLNSNKSNSIVLYANEDERWME